MIIECQKCDARVHSKVISERLYPPSDYSEPFKYVFVECPSCSSLMLGYAEFGCGDPDDPNWSDATRLWPNTRKYFPDSVPKIVQKSLEDARKCRQLGVYTACAVMCEKALEAICHDKTEKKNLHEGLKELRSQNIIDERLYEWGEALRKERNAETHDSKESVEREDAQDILDFATVLVEYIYVLSAKFEDYQERKKFFACVES